MMLSVNLIPDILLDSDQTGSDDQTNQPSYVKFQGYFTGVSQEKNAYMLTVYFIKLST